MESRERRDAVAHPSASSDPAGGGRSRGRAAVRVGERADGWGYPVSGCVREREGAARGPAWAEANRAGLNRTVFVSFFFYAIYDVYI